MPADNGVLLDTHVWLWLTDPKANLRHKIRLQSQQAAAAGQLWVHAISVWEIAMLAQKQRIQLHIPVQAWIERACQQPGLNLLPLDPDIAIDSAILPNCPIGDPADRILIASARMRDLILLTRDARILAYSQIGNFRSTPA